MVKRGSLSVSAKSGQHQTYMRAWTLLAILTLLSSMLAWSAIAAKPVFAQDVGYGPNGIAEFSATSFVAGEGIDFTIIAFNEEGERVEHGGDTVAISTSLGTLTPASTPTDVGDGTYTASLSSTATGVAELAITLNGAAIKNSPFQITVQPGPLDHFTWAPISQRTAGTSFSITATARDEFGNTKTDYTGIGATLTSNLGDAPDGTEPTIPANLTWGAGSGIGSADVTAVNATAFGSPNYAATENFTITDGDVTTTSADFSVTPAALDRFAWDSIGQQTAGTSFAIKATAYDQFDNVKTNYAGSGAVLTSSLVASPSGATPSVPANLTWGTGTGIGTANPSAKKATSFASPSYTASETFTITASAADGSKTATTGAFAVAVAASTELSFGTTTLNGTYPGGQPIDTKVNSIIYSSCVRAAVGVSDPCTTASDPVKVLATDEFGNRKPAISIGITRHAVSPSTFGGTFAGTTPVSTSNGTGTTPIGEAWFSDLKITTISGAATDKYKLTAAATGADDADSSNFRIVSDLANCTGQTKCFNNTKNNSVDKPENSYSQSKTTVGNFGNVITTTNFSDPTLDVNARCTGVRTNSTIGSAIDVRVVGAGLATSKPTSTMVMILPIKTLKFYGLTARNADSYNVCLGAIYLDSDTATSWTGRDKKNKALEATQAPDADGIQRWWGVPADCSQKYLDSKDPCISLKTKSASAVAARMTQVTGETWTVTRVNSELNFFDGDIAIFVTKPFPWDGKGGLY